MPITPEAQMYIVLSEKDITMSNTRIVPIIRVLFYGMLYLRVNNMLDFKKALSRFHNEYDPLVM